MSEDLACGRFAVVSVDMFQTLVDVTSRRRAIWHTLLGERYSEPLAQRYWALSERVVLDCFDHLSRGDEFLTVKQIFSRGFAEVFRQTGLEIDPCWAAEVAAAEHARAAPYDDTLPFLEAVSAASPVALVCDGDEDMLPRELVGQDHLFDQVFLSERLRAYKRDPQGRLFAAVVAHYGLAPERIVHIGDSPADVIGAHRAGMRACWLNRTGAIWVPKETTPDYEVRSLAEVTTIVGLGP